MQQITLENEVLRIIICPSLGGKITSFFLKEKDFELAAQSSKEQEDARCRMEEKKERSSFAPYAYGMDDAFPGISGEEVEWNNRRLLYPDHGEIWKEEFQILEQEANRVSLCWHSPAFHYQYVKNMRLEKNTLIIQYHIQNEGEEEFPCIWTWHGLLRYEQDMEILLPDGIEHYQNALGGCFLGEEGTVYSVQNDIYDFRKMPDPDICDMVKYYGLEVPMTGHCGVHYPSKNVVHLLDYDAEKLPFFGVWITAGGLQGDFNCALEPTNGYYDSIERAWKNQKLPVLKSGEELEFTLELTLRELDLPALFL